ncbi:hypothetical protein A3A64_03670 [Candidatus Gottesmanbacteria bacterium RIFCSPLOWO2_01_FULL_48_11]|uniref:Uncharacterized protein n=1 Tax=Candidatus Gottesmanbacteria bacterium RIFCSPLOWO2_01_FULL_48_11 TaxID=1798395 RepID=A0A1F6AUQ5_9BACT|nr:MAG: hypothetical protein A3A64_03670 [Candidatus Gottesmanbacteria bacterium RIFCSPLOWO2_01_FULL_48_11]
MDDRRRTLAAITVLLGILVLAAIVVGVVVSAKKTVSPVPEEGAIKIIFTTPTPTPVSSPSATLSPSPTTKATTKPTATPTP